MQAIPQSMTVMEAGFKIKPGQEQEFLAAQAKMVPVGMAQPGFVSVYGGPIADSDWLYFGVRFASQDQMDTWHNNAGHRAMQAPARGKWWTAVYIRKWRRPVEGDAFGDRVFSETRIDRAEPFGDAAAAEARAALQSIAAHGAARFETLSGEFEPQPYQLVGPLEIAPSTAPASYSLLAHWRRIEDLRRWQDSPAYRRLGQLGTLQTEAFIPFAEPHARLGLRADRLQRDWTLDGRHPQG